jgi:UDP-N-acetylglucosamine/UDP-N-acetylgalactosamine diphosphorylase
MLAQLTAALEPFDQTHLLRFWEELDEAGRAKLAAHIESVDLPLMQKLLSGSEDKTDWAAAADQIAPAPAVRLNEEHPRFSADQALAAGEAALKAGRVGAVLVAGGQGTRLGFPQPKGMFPLGPVSNRTLFEILVGKLRAQAARFNTAIPLYLMTSPATHEETVAYMQQQNRLGLPEADLRIFSQGTMPAAAEGKLLLAEKDSLALSPDGHGGCLAALHKSGALADATARGIDTLFYFQVDNALAPVCDAAFIGYHLLAESEMTTLAVAKTEPHDKVGNVVTRDGKAQVIEYSELPDVLANRRNDDGSLALWAGSIAVHAFDVPFLQRAADDADGLPFHRAQKKVPFVNEAGEHIEPSEPNAVKFERFIFDLMPQAKNALVVEGDEADVFAPVKNASGAAKDTKETAQAAMIAQDRRRLEAAGVSIADGVQVEIDPALAATNEALRQRIAGQTEIKTDTYFFA